MCRFVLYLGEPLALDALTTRPRHSLIHQSYKSRERKEPLNGDGFGIAWYVPAISDKPAIFRSTKPAWSDTNLREIARVTTSHCILAHVRAATRPHAVTMANCHPFGAGNLALMHNGFIPSFGALRRKLLRSLSDEAFALIRGTTDSEHILAMIYDRFAQSQAEGETEKLVDALVRTLRDIDTLVKETGSKRAAHLNVAVSDGKRAVVSRWGQQPELADSLHLHRGMAYSCKDGDDAQMLRPAQGYGAVLVASEPLTRDPGWEPVAANQLVVIDEDLSVEARDYPTSPAS